MWNYPNHIRLHSLEGLAEVLFCPGFPKGVQKPSFQGCAAFGRVEFRWNIRDDVFGDVLAELPIFIGHAAPPENFISRPTLQHLPDDCAATTRDIWREFSSDQKFLKIGHGLYLHSAGLNKIRGVFGSSLEHRAGSLAGEIVQFRG